MPLSMMGSALAGAASGVAYISSCPASRNRRQLSATSLGSKSRLGSGIRMRALIPVLAALSHRRDFAQRRAEPARGLAQIGRAQTGITEQQAGAVRCAEIVRRDRIDPDPALFGRGDDRRHLGPIVA